MLFVVLVDSYSSNNNNICSLILILFRSTYSRDIYIFVILFISCVFLHLFTTLIKLWSQFQLILWYLTAKFIYHCSDLYIQNDKRTTYIISAIEKPKNNLFQTICVRNLKYRPVFILHIFVIHGVLRCESISTSDFVQRNTFSKIKTKKVINQNKIDFHSWASLRAMVNLIRLVPLSDILKNVFLYILNTLLCIFSIEFITRTKSLT